MTQLEAIEVVAGLIARERGQIATVRKLRDRPDLGPDGTIEVVMTDAATGERRGTGVFPPGSLDGVADEDLRDALAAKVPNERPTPFASIARTTAPPPVGAVLAQGHVLTFTSAEVRALLRAGSGSPHRTPHLTSALDKLWEAE